MEEANLGIQHGAFAMKRLIVFGFVIALISAPAMAQDAPPPAPPSGEDVVVDEEFGLTGTVTAEGAWQDLGIAIAAFATDRETATAANSQGTGALGLELSRVVYNDLRNNGLFRPTGPDTLPHPSYA